MNQQDEQQLLKLILARDDDTRAQLYDLRKDPGETTHLYRQQPELARTLINKRISAQESVQAAR